MANSSPIEVQKYLKGIDYPATKKDLLEKARSNGANKEILSLIEDLKEDKFANPAEVSKGIGALV
jgi:hypothetical protein